jgi:hypothetical protein
LNSTGPAETTRINTATTVINGRSSGKARRITAMSRIRFQRKTGPVTAEKASRGSELSFGGFMSTNQRIEEYLEDNGE